MSVAASAACAADVADWAGEWDTRWRDGGARISLEQDGTRVWGEYPLYQGRIEAEVRGRELAGRWIEPKNSGSFVFVQSRDGKSFSGRFESGEWWTGARSERSASLAISIEQATPELTFKAFMQAMNAIGPGSMDLLGEAALLLAPGDEAEAGISRLDHARLLFDVLDGMTFRIWGISRNETTNRFSKKLKQAGSDVSLELEFVNLEDKWYIAPPPPALLEETRAALSAARPAGAGEFGDLQLLKSPRDTIRSFLLGTTERGFNLDNPAIHALNMSEFTDVARDREAVLLANYLKRTLDRVSYIIWQELPDDPAARQPYVHFQHPAGDIVVAPYPTPEGVIWQFTPDTLRNIRTLYAAMDEMPLDPALPPLPPESFYFGMRDRIGKYAPRLLRVVGPLEGWQWLGLLLIVPLAYAAGVVVSRLLDATLLRRWRSTEAQRHPIADVIQRWSARTLLVGAALLLSDRLLGLPDGVAALATTAGWLLIVLTLTLIALLAISTVANRYRAVPNLPGHFRSLISLVAGVMRVFVLGAAVLLSAHLLAIPYQGVLAGLGIGGLAVALAAQPTLQNFLSGITLYLDRPIAVGDFCRFGDQTGTVEYIGMRSTRIRTPDRTVVSIPNSEFSNMQLENYAQRDQIFLKTLVQLRYETTPDQLRLVLVELRKLLIAHPKVEPDPLRVRFVGFGEHSLDVEIYAYVRTSDFSEYLAIREDVYLRIMTLVEQAGAQFAFPSAVHYHAQDVASDPARVKAAEAQVAAWRTSGALPFPDFDWRDKAQISNTLDYPPEGSTLAEVMRDPNLTT